MNTLSYIILFFLVLVCITGWLVQTLFMAINSAHDSITSSVTRRTLPKSLKMPALIICNKVPFSNEGLRSMSELSATSSIRYLQDWLNPSHRLAADYKAWDPQEQLRAHQLIAQALPRHIRKQLIANALFHCQSILQSCSFKGHVMNAAQCCTSVRQGFATMNGICWIYQNDTHIVGSAGIEYQFQVTFKIPQHSYQSEAVPTYPGIDVFLVDGVESDYQLMESMIIPITLTDKKGTQVRMRREVSLDAMQKDCGRTAYSAARADAEAMHGNKTNTIPCLVMAVMRRCDCHPLIAEFMDFDPIALKEVLQLLNSTEPCSLDSYDNCARSFMDYAQGWMREEPLPDGISRTSNDVQKCRRENHRSCGIVQYRGTVEQYDLSSEQSNSEDFITRLSFFYETRMLSEVINDRNPEAYSLFTSMCYNLAFWFTVGHLSWSLGRLFVLCCTRKNTVKRISITPATAAVTEQQRLQVPQAAPLKPIRKIFEKAVPESASATDLTPAANKVPPPRTLPPISPADRKASPTSLADSDLAIAHGTPSSRQEAE